MDKLVALSVMSTLSSPGQSSGCSAAVQQAAVGTVSEPQALCSERSSAGWNWFCPKSCGAVG